MRADPPDLANASVFVDFDGTITATDTGVHLHERLGPPEWREFETAYIGGAIGSRECIVGQWELLAPHGEDVLRTVAREVPVDPAFESLVTDLVARGAEVVVVSDGYGFRAREVCEPLGIEVVTNLVDFSTGEISFPNEDRCCPCSSCGTCKQAPIKDARRRGRTTVMIGDGVSDRKAALLADRLFAKGHLADWCDEAGVDHVRFESLEQVRRALVGR
jgi:2,3-diketo-5-methylthio-1-phosphopentane phosphatase